MTPSEVWILPFLYLLCDGNGGIFCVCSVPQVRVVAPRVIGTHQKSRPVSKLDELIDDGWTERESLGSC